MYGTVPARRARVRRPARGAAPRRPAGAVRRRPRPRALHEVRIPHPDARRRQAVHVGVRAQGRARHAIRSSSRARRTASARTASTPIARRSGRRRTSRRRASSSSTRTRAAATCRKASSSRSGPTCPSSAARRTWTRAATCTTRSRGCSTNVPNHNGRAGLVGVSQPGFHVAASIIDAHPALRAASPQAPTADYYLGDDVYHNGAFMLGANFGFYSSFQPRVGGPQLPAPEPRFDPGTPDAYEFFLSLPPLAEVNADAVRRACGLLAGDRRPPQLRRVLAGPVGLEAREEHHAGDPERRRLVRRRGSRWARCTCSGRSIG